MVLNTLITQLLNVFTKCQKRIIPIGIGIKLNVLLHVGIASLNLLLIGSGEHNIAMYGKGVGFFYSVAGGCHNQYLATVGLEIDKESSHAQFNVL